MNDQKPRSKLDTAISVGSACLVAAVAAAVICALSIVFGIVFGQMRKDAQAEKVGRVLIERIAQQGPQFKDVSLNYSFWANHRPKKASAWDQRWNSKYPSIVGWVKTPEELDEVKEIIRVVCEENGYDPQLVAFFVRLKAEEAGPNQGAAADRAGMR